MRQQPVSTVTQKELTLYFKKRGLHIAGPNPFTDTSYLRIHTRSADDARGGAPSPLHFSTREPHDDSPHMARALFHTWQPTKRPKRSPHAAMTQAHAARAAMTRRRQDATTQAHRTSGTSGTRSRCPASAPSAPGRWHETSGRTAASVGPCRRDRPFAAR